MERLTTTVPFRAGETLSSFLSRLAAANQIASTREFCAHTGLNFRGIAAGDPEAISELAYLSNVGLDVFSKGILRREGRRFFVNGAELTKSHVLRGRFRFCQACLERDEDTGTGPAGSRSYGRVAWLITFLRCCPVHRCLLHETSEYTPPGLIDDFSATWRSVKSVLKPALASPCDPGPFSDYVLRRLDGLPGCGGWLDRLPLYVVGDLSEIVGGMTLHGKQFLQKQLTELEAATSVAAGFGILDRGEGAFVDFLLDVGNHRGDKKGRISYGPWALFGKLYSKLHHDADPAFDPIRDIMVRTAVGAYPLGPGDPMFGPISIPRRWHSLVSASKQYGQARNSIRIIIRKEGLIGHDHARLTPDRVLIDAREVDRILARESDLMSVSEAATYLGLRRKDLRDLADAGFVQYHPECRRPMLGRQAVREFVDAIIRMSEVCSKPDVGLVRFADLDSPATRQARVVKLIVTGALQTVSRPPACDTIGEILLDPKELREAVKTDRNNGISVRSAALQMGMSPKSFRLLLENGHLRLGKVRKAINQTIAGSISADEFFKFKARYSTLGHFSKTSGRGRKEVFALIRQASLSPAIKVGRWSDLYESADLELLVR